MTHRVVVTGTDTGIGKTIFSAVLTDALVASYWKPVQSGLDEETDSQIVQRLGRIPPNRILPEAYRLNTPVSPHLAARIDGVAIQPDDLAPPMLDRPLVIEGAGGLLVPLTDHTVFADVFSRWKIPVVLCARTALGTINHTLLSLEALRCRAIPVLGVVFIGDAQPDTETVIPEMAKVRRLGRLPLLDPLTPDRLRQAFRDSFDVADFSAVGA
ncbi:dethiobiotin synthase [Ensifer sp.]|uniref:dethiobiotin synthase n=1 Tax=Ensifer sp. TaxID=1872086 RepID=UPI002E15D73A|nr:dethiobiotin synthase [Ensifer sp.]